MYYLTGTNNLTLAEISIIYHRYTTNQNGTKSLRIKTLTRALTAYL